MWVYGWKHFTVQKKIKTKNRNFTRKHKLFAEVYIYPAIILWGISYHFHHFSCMSIFLATKFRLFSNSFSFPTSKQIAMPVKTQRIAQNLDPPVNITCHERTEYRRNKVPLENKVNTQQHWKKTTKTCLSSFCMFTFLTHKSAQVYATNWLLTV